MKSKIRTISMILKFFVLILVMTSIVIEPAMAGRGYVYNHDQMFSYHGPQFDIEGEKVGERGHEYTRDLVYVRPDKNINLGDPEIACEAIKIIREKASENGMPRIAELTDYELMCEFAGRGNKVVIIHVDLDEEPTPVDVDNNGEFIKLKTMVGHNVVRDSLEHGWMLFYPDGQYAYTLYLERELLKERLASPQSAQRIVLEGRIREMTLLDFEFRDYYKNSHKIRFDRTITNVDIERELHIYPCATGYNGNVTLPTSINGVHITVKTRKLQDIVLKIDLDPEDNWTFVFDASS